MAMNRANAEVQATRDLFIGQSTRGQAQDIKLTFAKHIRKARGSCRRRGTIGETAQKPLAQGWLHNLLATGNRTNSLNQFMAIDVL